MPNQTDLSTTQLLQALLEGKKLYFKKMRPGAYIHVVGSEIVFHGTYGHKDEPIDYEIWHALLTPNDWELFTEPLSDKDRADQAEERLRKVEEFLQNLHPMPNEFAYKILSGTFQDLLTIVRGT